MSKKVTQKEVAKRGLVFIDFNGVISYKPFWSTLADKSHPSHSLFLKIQDLIFGPDPTLVQAWMTGKKTSEEIHETLEKNLGAPKELFSNFVRDCINLDVSVPIISAAKKLRSNFHLILRTDNMDTFSRWTLPAHPELRETFHEIYSSFELGFLKKTDGGKFFVDLAEKNGFTISQCSLLDDSTSNCALFRTIGGRAFQTTSEMEAITVLAGLGSHTRLI